MPKGKKDVMKAHAEKMGESVNAFVNRAITILSIALEVKQNAEFDT